MTTPRGFCLRAAQPADTAALLHVRTAVHENHLSLAELAERGITADALTALLAGTPASAWVAEDAAGAVLGFAMVDLDQASLFALFVLPTHEGRGIGSALLGTAIAAARARGLASLTLTTDRTLPWNAPFYARNGFVMLTPDATPGWLRAILRQEAAAGLKPEWRCAMHLSL